MEEIGQDQAEQQSNSAQILNALIPDQAEENGGEGQGAGVEMVPASTVDNLAGLLSLIGIGFEFKGYMRAAAVWHDGACKELAAKLVPVFVKYSWGQRFINFLNTGGGIEELALFPVAVAMISSTYNAVMADRAGMQKETVNSEPLEPGKVHDVGSPLGSTVQTA